MYLGVGGAGCQSFSCPQSGGTGLTTPIGQTDMPYLVCVGRQRSHTTLSYAHTVYPEALCGLTPCPECWAVPVISQCILPHVNFSKFLHRWLISWLFGISRLKFYNYTLLRESQCVIGASQNIITQTHWHEGKMKTKSTWYRYL